uniref:Uncharacterized protein n=1 Tax=Cacopsylla melanoneura TaxID=428564 RepID=A0A8D8YWC2_9HEMI
MTTPSSPPPAESPGLADPNSTPEAPSTDLDVPAGLLTRAWSSMRASTRAWRMPRVRQEIVLRRNSLSFLEQARMSPDIRVKLDDIQEWLSLQDYIDDNIEAKYVPSNTPLRTYSLFSSNVFTPIPNPLTIWATTVCCLPLFQIVSITTLSGMELCLYTIWTTFQSGRSNMDTSEHVPRWPNTTRTVCRFVLNLCI